MSRNETTLQNPGDLTDFPVCEITKSTPLSRVHNADLGPQFFSCFPGRFNLFAPRGTLNLASDPHTALREFLGPTLVGARLVPESFVADKVISNLSVQVSQIADLSAETAPAFGVVETDMMAPQPDEYQLTRSWAQAFDRQNFSGIRARARFGIGSKSYNFYLFGDAGEHDVAEVETNNPALTIAKSLPGVTVVKTPSAALLKVES